MSDHWDFYASQVDGAPASIFVDMGIAEAAPRPGYAHMAYLRLSMRQPRADGLSSQEEFDTLVAIEDQLTRHVEATTATIYVGRNTSNGDRDFYFYARDPGAFEAAARAAMAGYPNYVFETGANPDAEWSVYFDFLYPSPEARQCMGNRAVVEKLREKGDRIEAPRQIDHFAYFTNQAGCAAFVQDLRRDGFQIEPGFPQWREGRLTLQFHRQDAPAMIDDVTLPLFPAAIAAGGEYDGWGCGVETG